MINWLKKKWSRLCFDLWKLNIIATMDKLDTTSLVRFPVMLFLELEAEKIFEESGLVGVAAAFSEKLGSIGRAKLFDIVHDTSISITDCKIGEEVFFNAWNGDLKQEEGVVVSRHMVKLPNGTLVRLSNYHKVWRKHEETVS